MSPRTRGTRAPRAGTPENTLYPNQSLSSTRRAYVRRQGPQERRTNSHSRNFVAGLSSKHISRWRRLAELNRFYYVSRGTRADWLLFSSRVKQNTGMVSQNYQRTRAAGARDQVMETGRPSEMTLSRTQLTRSSRYQSAPGYCSLSRAPIVSARRSRPIFSFLRVPLTSTAGLVINCARRRYG